MNPPGLLARVAAGAAALAVCFVLLLAPMGLYRLATGQPLEGPGQDWELWLLIGGGAMGTVLGRLVHQWVMVGVFGHSSSAEEEAWEGRRRRR